MVVASQNDVIVILEHNSIVLVECKAIVLLEYHAASHQLLSGAENDNTRRTIPF